MVDTGSLARIRLVGGPRDLPEELRSRTAPDGQRVVKIEHRGGYEHFHRSDEPQRGQDDSIVFRWVWRTRIAE